MAASGRAVRGSRSALSRGARRHRGPCERARASAAPDAGAAPAAQGVPCPGTDEEVDGCLADGAVTVQDDLTSLLEILPRDVREPLLAHPRRADLLEIVFDLGRAPEARFLGDTGSQPLRESEVCREELAAAEEALGEFGGDNRAGITGTLHRISCLRNRRGVVVGLTCRVGRAVTGHVDMIRDLLDGDRSVLFLGRPGVGKTTVIREMARVLSDECRKRVVIVDTSNEIGGDGDVPHPAIGSARRMQVADPAEQHRVMVEAVQNHMPQVVIVDEIGTEAEALACRTIAERGVQLIGTAHGRVLQNLLKNPVLTDLVGGVESVTLGDEAARARGSQKTVLERKAAPTFPIVIEMRERSLWIEHNVADSVDALLQRRNPVIVERSRNGEFEVEIQRREYDPEEGCGFDGGAAETTGRHAANAEWAGNLKGLDNEPFAGAAELDALQSLAMVGSLDPLEAELFAAQQRQTSGRGRGRGRRRGCR